MSSPRWSVLVIALLLGLATGDAMIPKAKQEEGNVKKQVHEQSSMERWVLEVRG